VNPAVRVHALLGGGFDTNFSTAISTFEAQKADSG
jgi:hypothetical protein